MYKDINHFIEEKNLKEIGVDDFLNLQEGEKIFVYYKEDEVNADFIESGYFVKFEVVKLLEKEKNDIDFRICYDAHGTFTYKNCFATQVKIFKQNK